MHFTFRPCRPFCLFTWELWQTPLLSVVCWEMLQTTCRSDWDFNILTVGRVLWIIPYNCSPPCVQGVLESFLGTAIAGAVFCLLAGQPLTILSSTGPVLVFERLLFNFSRYVLCLLSFPEIIDDLELEKHFIITPNLIEKLQTCKFWLFLKTVPYELIQFPQKYLECQSCWCRVLFFHRKK